MPDRILYYIDDDSDDLTTFMYAAKELAINVRLFKSGRNVLEELEQGHQKPFAILVDLNMPIMNGFQIIQNIVDNHNILKIPVIAFSTASDEDSIEKAKEAGATCYISKPTSIGQIKKILRFVSDNDWQAFDRNKNFLPRVKS
jgi:CheY-like chemotaxis protein